MGSGVVGRVRTVVVAEPCRPRDKRGKYRALQLFHRVSEALPRRLVGRLRPAEVVDVGVLLCSSAVREALLNDQLEDGHVAIKAPGRLWRKPDDTKWLLHATDPALQWALLAALVGAHCRQDVSGSPARCSSWVARIFAARGS